jgi:phage gp46-like protein
MAAGAAQNKKASVLTEALVVSFFTPLVLSRSGYWSMFSD